MLVATTAALANEQPFLEKMLQVRVDRVGLPAVVDRQSSRRMQAK